MAVHRAPLLSMGLWSTIGGILEPVERCWPHGGARLADVHNDCPGGIHLQALTVGSDSKIESFEPLESLLSVVSLESAPWPRVGTGTPSLAIWSRARTRVAATRSERTSSLLSRTMNLRQFRSRAHTQSTSTASCPALLPTLFLSTICSCLYYAARPSPPASFRD